MTESIEPHDLEIELDVIAKRTTGEGLPQKLQELTERHLARVLALVETMRAAGIDEALVHHSVREIIDSYENELIDALQRISEERQ